MLRTFPINEKESYVIDTKTGLVMMHENESHEYLVLGTAKICELEEDAEYVIRIFEV